MTCIKMGSDESHFSVSLIMRGKVTRQSPQLLKRKESRSGIEPRSFRLPAYRLTARPNRLSRPSRSYGALGFNAQSTVYVPPPPSPTHTPNLVGCPPRSVGHLQVSLYHIPSPIGFPVARRIYNIHLSVSPSEFDDMFSMRIFFPTTLRPRFPAPFLLLP